jgi:hypothetical protein
MDPSWTRERVVATVAEQFPPELRETVLRALDVYPGDTPAGRARLQLAILKIAGGNVERVHQLVAHAAVDFRDILYTANLQSADGGP